MIPFEFAVGVVKQLAFDVNTHVTTSRFDKVELVYVVPVPTEVPFTFQEYTGEVPPFDITELKVIAVPVQADAVVVLIAIAGTIVPTKDMVIELDVTAVVVAQVAFDVKTHETISPFRSVELVYVSPVPTLLPFTFH